MNKNQVLAATLSGNKELIRKQFLEKRNLLSKDAIDKHSKTISDKLLANFDFKNQNTHLFYPIEENNEVNTWFLHNELILQNSNLLCSYHNLNHESWDCIEFDPKIDFIKTTFKVPIPLSFKKSSYNKIDVIIVPLLAFDNLGYRVGYGKGIYDYILSKVNNKCIKIGVSFFNPISEKIESEKHDMKLDYCQTPNYLHKFI